MEKNSVASLLTSVDSLFTTQEERDTATQPRVQEIPIDKIDDFPNHPFKVRMDDNMIEMAESVKQHGILVPAIVRPKENGHYEMVAGHRRKLACTLIAKLQLPCIVRELTDEEATVIMVDSNLQREQLLPSEKAFAYKMKLDAMKRQGQRTDLTCATPLHKLSGVKSRNILAEQSGESHEQVRKYIRLTSLIALCLALVLCFGSAISVSAAEVADAYIDESRMGSLIIFKYDLTGSENAGIWDSSYVSTGVADENDVGDVLADYALEGVEFSYVKVADIVQFSESTADSATYNHVEVLYAIDKVQGADFLKALGLENGASRYENADQMDTSKYFYQSDVLIHALSAALTANSTVVKNAMEQYIAAIGGTAMPLTDSFGKTKVENLELGLYLIVETKVPENVVSTTDPFLISLPMTSVNGTNATDGGTHWIYDVTVYPKNQTGEPTLEKTLRESKTNTGKNNGTSAITDGFAHTGTASGGDTVEYQIISTLPAITSESTYLTTYTFVDTLSKGLTYAKGGVVLEFFTDAACTDSVAKWTEADGKFTAAYNTVEAGESITIAMTQTGLAEMNTSKAVYSAAGMVNSGYSDLTLRITYAAKLDSDNSVAYGDDGNPNEVVLTWKRTSTDYSDTLADDCHLYTYGIDLTKKFSDGNGDFSKVEFVLFNETDNYYVKAALNEGEGIYYVTAHVADEVDATHFIPVTSGKVVVKGLEDDTYCITEVRTDNGYTLLKEDIEVVISQTETAALCDDVDGSVEHHLLTASAKVDGNAVTMLADDGSANAEAPLTVVNTRGFDLPETGDNGTMMFTIVGILLMAGAVAVLIFANRKKSA